MRLVYKKTQEPVKVGDVVPLDERQARVDHFREPHKPSSSGKVTVTVMTGEEEYVREFFVNVIGAEWIEREDR
jgi:hypothetical protein